MPPELADRYLSVEQFSEDIRRHQAGESVLGHPESATYQATKFIRRNRLAVAAATLAMGVILGGGLATFWQAHQAMRI